ncbi:hypothetical protein L6452_02612 [Arctium lappa]|uniref:Uncharacterized protein n=1 Tax=Arctium lappa TaxID=4217 RepID=A0ACB9FKI3_ARCLA|nr:hypothetical protein L6452_02612 [Arctium lappa]
MLFIINPLVKSTVWNSFSNICHQGSFGDILYHKSVVESECSKNIGDSSCRKFVGESDLRTIGNLLMISVVEDSSAIFNGDPSGIFSMAIFSMTKFCNESMKTFPVTRSTQFCSARKIKKRRRSTVSPKRKLIHHSFIPYNPSKNSNSPMFS